MNIDNTLCLALTGATIVSSGVSLTSPAPRRPR